MSRYHRWKGHCELVLEDYYNSRRQLAQLEQDAIYAKGEEQGRHGSGVADPTFRAALKLSNSRIERLRVEVRAIEQVRRSVPPHLAELMDVCWIKRRNNLQAAADLLGISYPTAKRWKKRILTLLAKELGWI